jgi:hypothetical protein
MWVKIDQIKGRYVNRYVIDEGDDLLVVDFAWRGRNIISVIARRCYSGMAVMQSWLSVLTESPIKAAGLPN